MVRLFIISCLVCICSCATLSAQEQPTDSIVQIEKVVASSTYVFDPLAPSKAAFYSAVLPGLGQVYNKAYWKVPIVYGGMGLSLYYYKFNNDKYHEYRDAYRDRLAGREVTGDIANFSDERLVSAQRFHQRNRDLSMLITVGLYVLNIVEANVDAHLSQFNVDENLSLRPVIEQNMINNNFQMGLSLNYQF